MENKMSNTINWKEVSNEKPFEINWLSLGGKLDNFEYTTDKMYSLSKEAYNKAKDFYDKLQDDWISIKDRLPNQDNDYFVWMEGIGSLISYFELGEFMEHGITYWKPIPESPIISLKEKRKLLKID